MADEDKEQMTAENPAFGIQESAQGNRILETLEKILQKLKPSTTQASDRLYEAYRQMREQSTPKPNQPTPETGKP